MKKIKLSIIGCGNIGLSMLQGFLKEETIIAKNITVTRRNVDELSNFKQFGNIFFTRNNLIFKGILSKLNVTFHQKLLISFFLSLFSFLILFSHLLLRFFRESHESFFFYVWTVEMFFSCFFLSKL